MVVAVITGPAGLIGKIRNDDPPNGFGSGLRRGLAEFRGNVVVTPYGGWIAFDLNAHSGGTQSQSA
jgi:hypothetical protein